MDTTRPASAAADGAEPILMARHNKEYDQALDKDKAFVG